MKFALFAMALTLFVSAFGQFCEAVPDTSLDGNAARLLRKKSSPEPKKTTKPPFQHLSLQKVDVSFQGDLDGEPTGEELDFFNDCFMVSYDEVFGDSGYQIDFAALSDAPVRRERRGLRCSQNWNTWYGESCRYCWYDNPDDDDTWNRALEEGQSPAQRFLADPEGSDWSDAFHQCLLDGPFVYFHSIEDVTFTLDGTPLMHGSLHN